MPQPPPHDWLARFLAEERLPDAYRETVEHIHRPIAEQISARAAVAGATAGRRTATPDRTESAGAAGADSPDRANPRCFTVGICGPQGSGKSTMTGALRGLLQAQGISVAVLSIDDLYLTHDARVALSRNVHPLLLTRGVPGTHDVPLGVETFAALARPGTVALPSFDKAQDDRRARDAWPRTDAPVQVILFEGWCVGARPQTEQQLLTPINALEHEEDRDGAWRRYVNKALATKYPELFGQIDLQILLQAPSFEVVFRWRSEQESKLKQRLAAEGADSARTMDDAALLRFISHYERLTRHILDEMPARADLIVRLDEHRGMSVALPQ